MTYDELQGQSQVKENFQIFFGVELVELQYEAGNLKLVASGFALCKLNHHSHHIKLLYPASDMSAISIRILNAASDLHLINKSNLIV